MPVTHAARTTLLLATHAVFGTRVAATGSRTRPALPILRAGLLVLGRFLRPAWQGVGAGLTQTQTRTQTRTPNPEPRTPNP